MAPTQGRARRGTYLPISLSLLHRTAGEPKGLKGGAAGLWPCASSEATAHSRLRAMTPEGTGAKADGGTGGNANRLTV